MKREAVEYLVKDEQLSNRRACKLTGISRSTFQYKAKPKDDSELQQALTALTDKHAAIGFTGNAVTVFGTRDINGIINAFTVYTLT